VVRPWSSMARTVLRGRSGQKPSVEAPGPWLSYMMASFNFAMSRPDGQGGIVTDAAVLRRLDSPRARRHRVGPQRTRLIECGKGPVLRAHNSRAAARGE
jgi:hypothetical protein